MDKTNIQHLPSLKIIHSACQKNSNSFLNYYMPYSRTPFQNLLQDKLFIPNIKKYLEWGLCHIKLQIISVVIKHYIHPKFKLNSVSIQSILYLYCHILWDMKGILKTNKTGFHCTRYSTNPFSVRTAYDSQS